MADPSSTDSSNLREMIGKRMKKIGILPEGRYLPENELDDLLKRENIQRALGGGNEVSSLVDYVLEYAPRTFAALVLVFTSCNDVREAMKSIQENKFTDASLESLSSSDLFSPCFNHLPWDEWTFEIFKDHRRQHFILPKFQVEKFIYEFDNDRLLPFRSPSVFTPSGHGHFSEVKCAELLASHQDKVVVSKETVKVALKILKSCSDPNYNIPKEFEREARAYEQLSGKSPHIIQAFGAYRLKSSNSGNDTYCLVLEWADGGSLLDFWQKYPESQVNDTNICEVRRRIRETLKQLHGLAQALEAMHSTKAQSSGHSTSGSVPQSPEPISRKISTPSESNGDVSIPVTSSSSTPIFQIDPPKDENGVNITINFDSQNLRPGDSTPENTTHFLNGKPNNHLGTMDFGAGNWRHGDIKPENILRFLNGKLDNYLGTLKLADLGRAQQHQVVTNIRRSKETELWRTRWYEPPDLEKTNHEKADGKISRLFDIWSMGCVIFEVVLWLLYGYNSHKDFLRANGLSSGEKGATPYWKIGERGTYVLSDAAAAWMKHILDHYDGHGGAIVDLVKLVKDRLLQIDLPPDSGKYTPGCRTNAKDLEEQLRAILKKAEVDENYLFTEGNSISMPLEFGSSIDPSAKSSSQSSLQVNGERKMEVPKNPNELRRTMIAQQREYTNNMNDEWKTVPEDSSFVASILEGRELDLGQSKLCANCAAIDLKSQHANCAMMSFDKNKLYAGRNCHLCEVFDTAAEALKLTTNGNAPILLEQSGCDFMLRETNKKVLRLGETAMKKHPRAPLAASILEPLTVDRVSDDKSVAPRAIIKLIGKWLEDCDENHSSCAPRVNSVVLPTRLIDVTNPEEPKIIVTADLSKDTLSEIRYIALSHMWGNIPGTVVTTKGNINLRKVGIPIKLLNDNALGFSNAIAITIALGCSYLWIDCLCILQGSDGDFDQEADKMQMIFNRAYCVLAVCNSPSGGKVGFLNHQRPQSKCARIGDLFISAVTNDFERDVLQSPLSRRGWVLQERALARRTVYFTETQTYWECGDGIRCETLAKLKNDKTAFLGDPNFPDYTIRKESSVGEQIDLWTNLFQQYSRLKFSYPEDRPIAIDGIMERLTVAFRTRSLAGLFHTFWGRCLLWRRADDSGILREIPHGKHSRRTPPSWSWMAYDGAISFLEPGGGEVEWNESDVTLPVYVTLPIDDLASHRTSWLRTSCQENSSVAIQAKAFDFDIPADTDKSEVSLYYDGAEITSAKCVIIGTEKLEVRDISTKKHYVLIVKPVLRVSGGTFYERCGVGYVSGKFIRLDGPSITVTIE
ncbi:serine threonine kinase protein [Rutstroemia sp. NJR-2017a WRK4]|nr:serine threonine kinase protein [Rutstroemia sp. NJR-2017a WRK4]